MIEKLGGRKTVTLIIVLLVSIATIAMKGDIPANFLMLLQTVFGAYVLGNGVEHVSKKKAKEEAVPVVNEEAARAGQEAVLALNANLIGMNERLDVIAQAIGSSNEGIKYLVEYTKTP